jgi:hypothetical protein
MYQKHTSFAVPSGHAAPRVIVIFTPKPHESRKRPLVSKQFRHLQVCLQALVDPVLRFNSSENPTQPQ